MPYPIGYTSPRWLRGMLRERTPDRHPPCPTHAVVDGAGTTIFSCRSASLCLIVARDATYETGRQHTVIALEGQP